MGGIWQHSNTAQLVCLECGQYCSLHSVEWFSLHCCTYVRVDVCCKCTHSAAWLVSLPRSLVLAGWSTQVSMLYFSMYLLFHVCVRMLYNLLLLVLRWYAEHMAITGSLCNSQFGCFTWYIIPTSLSMASVVVHRSYGLHGVVGCKHACNIAIWLALVSHTQRETSFNNVLSTCT